MTRVGRGGAGAEEVTQFSRNFLGMRLSGAWNDKDFKHLEYLRTFITHTTLIWIIFHMFNGFFIESFPNPVERLERNW